MDEFLPHLQRGKLSRRRLYWDPSLAAKRMRWTFYIYGPGLGKRKFNVLSDELAHLGYRMGCRHPSRRYNQTLVLFSLLKQLDFRKLCTEVHRVRAASERLGLLGLDCVDAEDPDHDDLRVN